MDEEDNCTTSECMYFYASTKSTLLFKSWEIDTDYEFWIAMGGIVTLGLLYEMVKSFRSCLIVEANNSALNAENKPILGERDGRRPAQTADNPHAFQVGCLQHFLCTLFYMLEVLLALILILIVVNFNVWNLLATVTGVTGGYLLFGKGRIN